jgi:hypothetical protein
LNVVETAGIEPPKWYDYVNLSMINTGFGHRVDKRCPLEQVIPDITKVGEKMGETVYCISGVGVG